MIKGIQILVLFAAFFLKILLFLLITWIIKTGRLIHFIIQEGSLNYIKEDQFKILLENVKLKETSLVEFEPNGE